MKPVILIGWLFYIVWGWQLERHAFESKEGCQAARAAILATGALKSIPTVTPCVRDEAPVKK